MNDSERKILTIIRNIDLSHSRFAKYDELLIKSGRKKEDLNRVLKSLVTQGHIFWDEQNTKEAAVNRTNYRAVYTRLDQIKR